jgi:hypothetical protein
LSAVFGAVSFFALEAVEKEVTITPDLPMFSR